MQQVQTRPPVAGAAVGSTTRPGGMPAAMRAAVGKALLQELFGTAERRVAVARRWLNAWLDHQQHLDAACGGSRVLCDLLYHVLMCPTELELTAYESAANAAHSISLQLLGPVDHGTPRIFSVLVDGRSSARLRWLSLFQLMMHHQQYFREVALNSGLCRGALYRQSLLNQQLDAGMDRVELCTCIFRLFLLMGLHEDSYHQAVETAQCAIRYLRERLESRGTSSRALLQRAHAMCLDMELKMDDADGVLLWIAEFVASYAYQTAEEDVEEGASSEVSDPS